MFLVKYNSSGNVIWAKGAGNIGYDIGMAVATDKLRNVVVSGEFSSPITFEQPVKEGFLRPDLEVPPKLLTVSIP